MWKIILLASLVSCSAAAAAEETPLAHGQRLAEKNCTRCHAVGPDGASPNPHAPPFRDVAKNYSYEELLDGFMEGLAVSHREMPDWDMTEDQAAAISTYIMSLRLTPSKPADSPEGIGYDLVRKHCARCHNIEASGSSPLPAAPPFREVVKRYAPSELQEPLAEGIVTGHNNMPAFAFSAEDAAAIVAYLETLKP